jgi:hypothetical protein
MRKFGFTSESLEVCEFHIDPWLPFPFLLPLAPPCSAPLLQHRRPPFSAAPHHLLLHFTSTRRPQLERRPSPLSSGPPRACYTIFPSARAPAGRHLTATMANADASSLPSLLLSLPVSFFSSCPSHFPLFPLPRTPRAPNTTAAPFLHSGDPLFVVGSSPEPSPHYYNLLGSFPSPH